MAIDEEFADRVRAILAIRDGLTEKSMFGGRSFLINRHMACGITSEGELMVRPGPEDFEAALAEEHARQFEMGGRKLNGWLIVAREGVESDEELAGWVDAGADYASTLPPKE